MSFELKVWDAAKGEEVLMLRGPMAGWRRGSGFGALASPRGLRSDETGMNIWDLGPRVAIPGRGGAMIGLNTQRSLERRLP